jgi:hypothetical protein
MSFGAQDAAPRIRSITLLHPGATDGLVSLTAGWLCLASSVAPQVRCYRIRDGKAETPIVLVYPAQKVVEVETANQPISNGVQYENGSTKPDNWAYFFDA